jgi:adenosylcobinamide-phosphate synthase
MNDTLWAVVLAAFILDYLFGDPDQLPHPVVYMGKCIQLFERPFRQLIPNLFVSGTCFAASLVFSAWLAAVAFIVVATAVNPALGILAQIGLLFFCFSSSSLEKAAMRVFHSLKNKDIDKARQDLGMIVGRQTSHLKEPAITRATIETVAENYVDGFLSPLFFACIGGVPLAVAYKMINTLDSMVGYKNDRYLLFGRGAARIDDAANFVPARLSVPIISLSALLMSTRQAALSFKTGLMHGQRHKSPNAGYPEAAFAGALHIRLGGPSIYHGRVVEKPFIGTSLNDPQPYMIKQACDLMMLASLFAVMLACLVLFVVSN